MGRTEYNKRKRFKTSIMAFFMMFVMVVTSLGSENMVVKAGSSYTDTDAVIISADFSDYYWMNPTNHSCLHQNSDGTITVDDNQEGANAILEKANTGDKDYILTINNLNILGPEPDENGEYADDDKIGSVIDDVYEMIDNLTIVVKGENTLGRLTKQERFLEKEVYSAMNGIAIGDGNLTITGDGKLNIYEATNGINAVNGNLTIDGQEGLKLNVTDCGVEVIWCCLHAGNDITIDGGTYNLLNGSTTCMSSDTGNIVIKDGIVNATTYSAYSDTEPSGVLYTSSGDITIEGGEVIAKNLNKDDEAVAIHSKGNTTVSGSSITVIMEETTSESNMKTGIFAKGGSVYMKGGNLNVTAGAPIRSEGDDTTGSGVIIDDGDMVLNIDSVPNGVTTAGIQCCNNSSSSNSGLIQYNGGTLTINHSTNSDKHYDIKMNEDITNGIVMKKNLGKLLKVALEGLDTRNNAVYPFPIVTYEEGVAPEFRNFSFFSFESGKRYSKLLGSEATGTDPNKIYLGEGYDQGYNQPYYTVSFNANGGTGVMEDEEFDIDGDAKALTANSFSRDGYTFAGWSTSKTGSVEYIDKQAISNLSTTDGETIILYAMWKKSPYYTVSFNANGGTGVMEDEEFDIDGDAKALTANGFSRDGYTFAGWSTTKTGTVVYNNQQKVKNLSTKDGTTVTLYAVWKENTIKYGLTVTVNSDYSDSLDLKVVKGNTTYATKTELEMGGSSSPYTASWIFTDILPGTYNVVATQKVSSLSNKEITVTEAVVITNSNKDIFMILPSTDTNSVLEITHDETPDIVVGGLADEANVAAMENTGKAIEIKMTVEEKNEEVAEGASDIKSKASAGEELEYFDFDIEKTIWTLTGGTRSVTPESQASVHNTANILTLLIPYDTNGKAAKDIKVYRHHNDGVNPTVTEAFIRYTSIPATPDDGHYYVDTENGLVYVYANKFSIYAIGYKAGGEENPPYTPPTDIPSYTPSGYAESVKILDPIKTVLTEKEETLQLTAVITPSNVSNKTLYWKSSNEKVLTVDGTGKVTAGEEGKAIITVSTVNGKSDNIELTVKHTTEEENEKPEDTEEKKPEEITPSVVSKNNLAINAGLKVSQTGSKINVSWGKIADADGYLVYATYCGTSFGKKPAKTVKNPDVTKVTITKLDGKALNLKKNYKLYIKAYKLVGGEKVTFGKSITAHIVGVKNTKNTNVKDIKLTSKSKLTIAVGKTSQIKAKVVLVDSTKKQLSDGHAAEFRYASSNKKIAIVDKNGKITAKAKGTCYIYVYAKNGYAKKVKVAVR